jgi:hypothetical protein
MERARKIPATLDGTVSELNEEIIGGHAIKNMLAAVGTYYVATMFLEAKRVVKTGRSIWSESSA